MEERGIRGDRRMHKRRCKWEEVRKRSTEVGKNDGWMDGRMDGWIDRW